ncbi:MAG: hypothetical protein Cons2KO_09940 [Congregibacter sp.]
MYVAFVGKQKSCADPDRASAQRERCGHAPAVSDASSCDHRRRWHRVHDGRRQYHPADLTPHMSASFYPLSDNDIDPKINNLSGVVC